MEDDLAVRQRRNDALLSRAIATPQDELRTHDILLLLKEAFPNAETKLGEPWIHGVRPGTLDTTWFSANNKIVHPWEDHKYINAHNENEPAPHYIRALISFIPTNDHEYLVLTIATKNLRYCFDEVDTGFVAACAVLLGNRATLKYLQDAAQTKHKLRGMSHHMRTPIRGMLAASELLQQPMAGTSLSQSEEMSSFWHATIKEAGRQLLQFANMVDRHARRPLIMTILDLDELEAQTITAILKVMSMTYVVKTCVYFERHLPDNVALVTEDHSLVLECLTPLLLNALQHTPAGSVVVRYSTNESYSGLVFDIRDTGSGVTPKDQDNIFKQSENESGLRLASKIAGALNGTVGLVSSSAAAGSLFRIILGDLTFACPWTPSQVHLEYAAIPRRYCLLRHPHGNISGVRAFLRLLENKGVKRTAIVSRDVLAVVPYTHQHDQYEIQLEEAAAAMLTISLIPNQANVSDIKSRYHSVLFFTCPFTTSRMKEILGAIDERCAVSAMAGSS